MDEQPRLPGPRSDEPALARAGLQGARDRSPDRPDAPSRLPSPVDGRRRPVAHDIRFQVHPVAPHVIHLHGLERPGADVEIELGHGDALRAEPRQQLKREVQPRGGRGDAAVVRRVDGLVALAIVGARGPADVRGEWHLPVFRQGAPRVERPDETHAPEPPTERLDDLDRAVVADGQASSRLELAPRMTQREPGAVRQLAHQQQLGDSSRVPLPV